MTGDVLVLRALGLGDALAGVAALRGVRRAWPDRRLWLAGPAPTSTWLRDLGLVDEVLPTQGLVPLHWPGHDHVAVNLHGSGPQSHSVLAATRPHRLVAFATEGRPTGPTWRVDEHEVDRWCRLVSSAGGSCDRADLRLPVRVPREPRLALLHPGAASAARRWPAYRWAAVARRLAAAGLDVVVTGGPGEEKLCDAVVEQARVPTDGEGSVRSRCGTLGVAALARLVASARLLVCGDTGVAHVATAVGTPSVLLFGPTSPALWGPAVDTDRHVVLWHGAGLRPGNPHGTLPDPTLLAITDEEVVAAAEALLDLAPPPPGA